MKYFSVIILSLPLIQEGHLSVSDVICAQVLVNRVEDYACSGKVRLGKLTGSILP